MNYTLKVIPYEKNMEDVENLIMFVADDDTEAKAYMCMLFYGYDTMEELYREFNFKSETDSLEGLVVFIMNYLDDLNDGVDTDYYESLTDENNKELYVATKEMIVESEDDYM